MKKIIAIVMMVGLFAKAGAQQVDTEKTQLARQQKSLISIAAATAKGDLNQLKKEIVIGFDSGLTINQIKEALVHLYAYCGFPRSLRGLQTLMEVIDERKAKGIEDKWGATASAVTDNRSKYERGKAVLGKLTGVSQDGPRVGYAAFAPEIEIFLKEHLFADIFERDVLTYIERELVTIAVLSSIGGVEPMLKSHLSICLNIGLTPPQLEQFVKVVKNTIGDESGKNAQLVLDEVLKNYKTN